MTVFEIITSILLFISSIGLIVIVLSQQGKDNYLGGTIAGGAAESFLGKNKARTIDTLLTRITRVLAIIVVLLTLAVNAAAIFFK
ncbi:MAG TPA: preprotein translocase subunit SecG [Ruminiclostridium sp.]|nr:preprotein translocase subunit SecG [Ruminiclostridium sp.]